MGITRLYAGTATAAALFEGGGWTLIDAAGRDPRHAASIFAIDLEL